MPDYTTTRSMADQILHEQEHLEVCAIKINYAEYLRAAILKHLTQNTLNFQMD